MISFFFQSAQKQSHRFWIEAMLAGRAILFTGRRVNCPCCGWKLRSFTQGNTSIKKREKGYCPRCNSKARHRRNWLFLKEQTDLFEKPMQLLHVSPKYALARRLSKMANIDFTGIDLEGRPFANHPIDVSDLPFESNKFDAIICIHVLEHVVDDRAAMHELHRVLKEGGWALITVPIDFQRKTYEDPTVQSAEARKIHFGEEQHWRVYGFDFIDRLTAAGFEVELNRAEDIPQTTQIKFGIIENEHVFFCKKSKSSQRSATQ